MENKDKLKEEIAWGVGAAIGVVINFFLRLGLLWVGLWVLSSLGWLPF
jgi:hypothetical protein